MAVPGIFRTSAVPNPARAAFKSLTSREVKANIPTCRCFQSGSCLPAGQYCHFWFADGNSRSSPFCVPSALTYRYPRRLPAELNVFVIFQLIGFTGSCDVSQFNASQALTNSTR